MADLNKVSNRNQLVQEMLTSGDGLKNFYRFTAHNPHIELHDACQIIIERPNASVCYSFDEWKAMGRNISKGSKGIVFFDEDRKKHYSFDSADTYGEKRFNRPILPLKCLLEGLDELNGTNLIQSGRRDYQRILSGVTTFLKDNEGFTEDEQRNQYIAEGVAYSLYCCTSIPKYNEVKLLGYTDSLMNNAQLFTHIQSETARVREEIEDAYIRRQQQVTLIDDTEEDVVSDEPIIEKPRNLVIINSAAYSQYKDYDVLYKDDNGKTSIYLGKRSNYDNKGTYDNTDNSLMVVSNNTTMFRLLQGGEYTISQLALEKENLFSEQDYKEYSAICTRFSDQLEQVKTLKFSVNEKNPSGVPFRYPYYKGNELYLRYTSAQDEYPDSIVLMRLGDFYEVLGEKAVIASYILDLTLTGRDCGLDERVPMCGFPFHVKEEYTKKLLEQSNVVFLEPDKAPEFVSSEQEEKVRVELEELSPEESAEYDEYFPMNETEDEIQDEYLDEELVGDIDDEVEEDSVIEEETPKEKTEKGLRERRRKRKLQPSLFDFLDEEKEEDSEQDILITRVLKKGGIVSGGKLRIYEKYQTNPTLKEFSKFLSDEYGWGGSSGPGMDTEMYNSKGIAMSNHDKTVSADLKWSEVATRIADLIDDDNYLNAEEKKEYARIVRFRKEREGADTHEKILDVIAKQIVEYGTAKTYSERFIEYPHFLEDYGKYLEDYREEVNERLLKYDEVERIYSDVSMLSNRELNVEFKLEYCPRWQERLKRKAEQTERLKTYAKTFITDCAEQYTEDNVVGNTVEWQVKDKYTEREFLFLKDNRDELTRILQSLMITKEVSFSMEHGFSILFYKDDIDKIRNGEQEVYMPFDNSVNTETTTRSPDDEETDEANTNLDEIGLNQNEFGGAKQRYRNNVDAIKLVNRLYRENRNPTDSEKIVLAKYVGWGGLQQAFDENNDKWRAEYKELKSLLSDAEYETAKGSVLNAHFTSKEVICGIYKALQRMGVKGNNKILEPALGTGNFFGFMPKEIAENAKLYGVELDEITGKIATKLYPQASIQIKGFEQTTFPNDKFDLMVSNVPFGNYSVYDTEYSKHSFQIHDYFIAKGIDKLKPNGLMAVITSKGTLDKLSPTVRKYIADRAELVGAIRLPNNAFKQTAGTEVTSDILFFQKREEKIVANTEDTEWLSIGTDENGYELNKYYITHPKMVCGTLNKKHGLYGAIDLTVEPDGRSIEQALDDAIKYLPENIYVNPEYVEETEENKIEVDYDVKPFCFKAENGKVYTRVGDEMVLQTLPNKPSDAYQRIVGMIGLRECVRNILNIQLEGCSDTALQIKQWELGSRYDEFVKRYGYINSQTNSKLFGEDADSALLSAIEILAEDKKTYIKGDIFTKRTIRPYTIPTHTDDAFEALQISRNEKGEVDIAFIEELTGKDYDTIITELGDTVYRNPLRVNPDDKYSGFQTQDEYLSGEVVKKLSQARHYVSIGQTEYERNVKALESVQPVSLKASEISVKLGASWIDKELYTECLCEMLKLPYWAKDDISVNYNKHDGSWKVDKRNGVYKPLEVTQVYGTERANAYRLFEDCMNQKTTQIYDTFEDDEGRTKRVLNQAETIAAREKQNKIQDFFKNWIYVDPDRREMLEQKYNSIFNQIRLPTYDGSHLTFPEMSPEIEPRPHQKNAVYRIVSTGENTLLHHVVGSGKTITMISAGMKLKQYGLAKKPMYVVPNHLVQQWADEFRKTYPKANILITQKDDLTKENRKRFVSKVAMGDWDGIIIAQSTFAKIGISKERQVSKIREEIDSIEQTVFAYYAETNRANGTVKNLERIKKSREAQLKKLLDDSKKDDILTFESLGVDQLFIDEADAYKNLFLYTKMNNVAGISNAASQRASDLQMKIEYINELRGGDKGVVFATGTPISNSMAEMYTLQTYLQKQTLMDLGIDYFDGWAADFGEAVMSLELAPSGQGYRAKTRFAKFTNIPELLTLYRSFADVITNDMVNLDIPEPDRKVVVIKPSDEIISLTEEIADRAEKIYGGGVDPHVDNMLKVTSDGKKIALDPRCYDSAMSDNEVSKLNECVNEIIEYYNQSNDIKGTQLVFCDLSTPKKAFEDYEYGKEFDAYNDLKYKLVQKGIPYDEIAFIHDAKTDQQKQVLFDKVNDGIVRVLIGSTEKCGAGTNVQKRLYALHHLDAPYRPRDLIQRDGRGIRQGNMNKVVHINTYVRERTFDSYSYQILENKQRFISQIDRGDLTIREAEDIDEATLSYAEIKAITSANPKIKRKMELDNELQQLRLLEGRYKKNLYDLQDKVRKTFPEQINRQELYLERLRQDIETAKEKFNPNNFSINVSGVTYIDRKEGARALYDALQVGKVDQVVAEYCGFKISLDPLVLLTAERTLTVAGVGKYSVNISQTGYGTLNRIDELLQSMSDKEIRAVNRLEQLKSDLESAKAEIELPFEHTAKIEELSKELVEINAELDLNKREEIVIDDGENEDGEIFMGILEDNNEEIGVRNKPRTRLSKAIENLYLSEQEKSPDAYIFIYDKGNYCVLGDKTERVSELSGIEIKKGVINGKDGKWLTMTEEEFMEVVNTLTEEKVTVKIAMPDKKQMEETFIDKSDLLEQMQVDLLPEYRVTQDDMHIYGYHWNGMLPMGKEKAKALLEMGLPIYFLTNSDNELLMENVGDIDKHTGFFGIEKDAWNTFITHKDTYPYIVARAETLKALLKATDNDTELNFIDRNQIKPIENIYREESVALNKFVEQNGLGDIEKAKEYLIRNIDEVTDRFAWIRLEEFGLDLIDVRESIVTKLENDELRKFAFNHYENLKQLIISELDKKEDNTFEIVNALGENIKVEPTVELYNVKDPIDGQDRAGLALRLFGYLEYDGKQVKEPYTVLTKNFGEPIGIKNCAYVDLNNNPFATQLLDMGYAKDTGFKKYSGFVTYPLWQFDEEFLKRIGGENYEKYSSDWEKEFIQKPLDLNEEIESVLDQMSEKETEELLNVQPVNYRQEVLDSIKEELNGYRTELINKPLDEILDSYYGIYVRNHMADFIAAVPLPEKVYEKLYEYKGEIIEKLNFQYVENDIRSETVDEYCMKAILDVTGYKDNEIEKPIHLPQTEEYEIKDDSDYSRAVIDSVEKEFDRFRTEMINSPQINVFNSNYKIHAYVEYLDVIQMAEYIEDEDYKILYEDRGHILESLYNDCLDNDNVNIENYSSVATHIKNYCDIKFNVLCKEDIEKTIAKNFDGKYLNKGFENDLIEKYGIETISYLLANSVQRNIDDGRYSPETKMWANNIPINFFDEERDEFLINTHPAVLDGFINRIRQIEKMEENKIMPEKQETSESSKKWLDISVPRDALKNMYENAGLFTMPKSSEYKGYSFYIPAQSVYEDTKANEERIVISVHEDFEIRLTNIKTKDEKNMKASELAKLIDGIKKEEYAVEISKTDEKQEKIEEQKRNDWHYASVTKDARLGQYEKSSLFKMPNGEYENYMYYLPNNFLKDNDEKQTVRIGLPDDFNVTIKDMANDDEVTLTAREFMNEIRDKDKDSYKQDTKKFIVPKKQGKFTAEAEQRLRDSLPDEMKDRPNWIAVYTRSNEEKGKVKKFLINPNNGDYAESDNPETWTNFEDACKYARENNCDAVAYAIDGKGGIACIDIDKCKDENGNYSDTANEVLNRCGKTYIETSVSGKGLHIFGVTDGMDVRTFSKDGELEFYQKAHFITMTGDGSGYNRLESFDKPDMKELIEKKCEKRTVWQGVCSGVEGLSSMTDRDVVEKASKGTNGDKFSRLYNGEDIFNDHSRSDMSLISRLVFWCNGDKEQILRIFATSGLYRSEKSPDYYECSVIKAIQENTGRLNSVQSKPKPIIKKTDNFNGGKR